MKSSQWGYEEEKDKAAHVAFWKTRVTFSDNASISCFLYTPSEVVYKTTMSMAEWPSEGYQVDRELLFCLLICLYAFVRLCSFYRKFAQLRHLTTSTTIHFIFLYYSCCKPQWSLKINCPNRKIKVRILVVVKWYFWYFCGPRSIIETLTVIWGSFELLLNKFIYFYWLMCV